MITRSVAERSLAASILWSARLNRRGAKPTARATEGGGFPGLLHNMRARDRLMAAPYQMSDRAPHLAAGERLEEVISEGRLVARVAELAREIEEQYRGAPLHLVVVLKGAFIFAADLVRGIKMPVTVDFIAASSYRGSTRPVGAVALAGVERLDLAGRHVVVVEDILDSGQTTAAILAAIRERRPQSLRLCVLLRKARARSLDLPIGQMGFDIGDDFVVGYGMDYAERYRNLRAVCRLFFEDGAA